ncbi:cobaltochelatase subunit CobN [Colwellia psychrerythraea]|uniref:Cobaltochelatase n=1 Tax=Colwellia psychrerythraea TaxID=28229 RepID=A0A099L256_COLPS|nr:cobaltochelatase subunit CobN [Colwellia psychrerythraea]KGJ96212.1 Cobaltochelatase [Colwellia psychrerythraea]
MITKILNQLTLLTTLALMCLVNVSIAGQNESQAKAQNKPESKSQSTLQDRPQILLMMSSHASKPKGDLLQLLAKGQPFELVNYSSKGKSDEDIKAAWSKASLIMLDGINPALSKYMFGKYQGYPAKFASVPVISMGDLVNTSMNQGLSSVQAKNIGSYYNNAGRDNYANLMVYLANDFLGLSSVSAKAPIIVPSVGLYHYDFPGLVSADEDAFFQQLNISDNQPVIAIGVHRSVIDYEQQQIVDALIKGLEAKGAKALAYFFEGEDQPMNFTDLLSVENVDSAKGFDSRVDLLINYRSLHFVAKRRSEFEKLGVPVLHALNYTEGDQASFEKDNAGISPSLTPFFLVMPEDTGSADPTIIAANNNGVKTAIDYQLNALVERAFNYANLAYIKNSEKKVATFIWNYPPGEKNIGAAFLDVPTSIENIAKAMKVKGYNVDVKGHKEIIESAGKLLRPYYRHGKPGEDAEQLIAQDLAEYMPLSTYLNWFNALPENVTKPIIERWGKPEESGMLRQAKINGETIPSFVIPRMNLGNMIVMPQGVRGEDAKEHANLYHSTKAPINHSYLAIYLFARETFGADAYIHLGTHGSQEWLTGKERGLSVYDAPSLALGNLPVFYPYIIDNVGEAMQAKRRGRATMISHLTPGFAKAGLYTEVATLSEKINNYLMLSEGKTKANTQAGIIVLAQELNMLKDLAIEPETMAADFDQYIAKLQDHLNALAQMSQPLGVHVFGDLPKNAHLFTTMLQMLGDDFTKRAAEYEQAHDMTVPAAEQFDQRNVKNLPALDGFQLLKAFIGSSKGKPVSLTDLDEKLAADLEVAKTYWQNFQAIAETQNLMLALDANYIATSYGGDPIRNPEATPTGRNLIGFNPAKVPSKEAYDAGVILMNQTIDAYVAKHGKFPEKLAFSLWSLETMRHQGALEAQILHALGLKPKWNHQGQVIGTEVIPYKDLKRPRIDVVISATGLYRDAFPNVMLWIAKAIDKVAKMKEDNNFVYRHATALKTELLEKGKSEEDADYLSSIRIFSNETGNYGTGLAGSSLASDTWETDDKLANLYLGRMGFAYGADEKRWSESVSNALGEGEGLYSKVLSGTNGVIFSRSTNLYALMTNDDPFQYFGGIGLAVRHLDGKTPEMYVSNLRKKDQLKVQTLAEFVNQEMRSRYFHPRWIKAMQDSGYAGATVILDRMNNMWGWEVMTPEAIRDDQWQEFFEVYVEDKYQMDMREFFEEHNAESLAQIIERMLEAVRKGYWDADEETIKKMVETYSELATQFDVATDNVKFNEYMDSAAVGFGMMPLSEALAQTLAQPEVPPPAEEASQATEQVSGQKLEEQAKSEPAETDYSTLYWLLVIFFIGLVSYFVRPTKKTVWLKVSTDDAKPVLDKAA